MAASKSTPKPTARSKKSATSPKTSRRAKPVVEEEVVELVGLKRLKLPKLLQSLEFANIYALLSLAILLATTTLWAVLSARVQQSNADQLVNSYLFNKADTFQNAIFPGQHSLLLKWPLFWLIHLFGTTQSAMIAGTVAISLITVLALAWILYKIEPRPLVFGTLCLALASVLLLIPAVPYPGALLPVNMAMLATRNLEYIVFIASLVILARYHEVKSWGFWLAVALLGLLIATDKLFLTIGLGGAVFALLCYVFMRRWKLAEISIKWVLASIFAGVLALVVLWAINALHITHITNQVTGGYTTIHSASQLARATIYAGLGFLTNFGANPAYSGLLFRDVPHLITTNLTDVGGVSFIINGLLILLGVLMAARLLIGSIWSRTSKTTMPSKATLLSLMLLWSSIAALAAFIVTDHYYPVDARYLTIALFAVFVSAATFLRQRRQVPKLLLTIGLVMVVSIIFGSIFAVKTYHQQVAGLQELNNRDSLVAQALSHHAADTLVGDYWRVVPTEEASKNKINIFPLADCLQPRNSLTSTSWQLDLHKNSFAYLLSLDRGQTDFPNCNLDQVLGAYGKPNASAVIAGSVEHPKEILLFYDKGIKASSPAVTSKTSVAATVVPIPIDDLPYTSCNGPTVMNVVAHEDDDLLFMNPDTQKDIKAGHCVRTVYVTAGDAGSGEFYWLSREQGAEAAYSTMNGTPGDLWIQRIVKVNNNAFITVANPKNNPRLSLIFLNLPDGNVKGQGFAGSHNASLARLHAGQVGSIQSVNRQTDLTADQLTGLLANLMHVYQPGEIRTQSSFAGHQFIDHSDHMAVGRFATQAHALYEQQQFENKVQIPIRYYLGYPIHEMPANVAGEDLQAKEAAFFAYAKFDGAVCPGLRMCPASATIDAYLMRQYQNPE